VIKAARRPPWRCRMATNMCARAGSTPPLPGRTPGPQGDVTFGGWAFAANKPAAADSPSIAGEAGPAAAVAAAHQEGQENRACAAAAAGAAPAAPAVAAHATPSAPRPAPPGPAGVCPVLLAGPGISSATPRSSRSCKRLTGLGCAPRPGMPSLKLNPRPPRFSNVRPTVPRRPAGAAATPMASAASCTVAGTPGSMATTLAGGLATGGEHSVMARPGGTRAAAAASAGRVARRIAMHPGQDPEGCS
jgi:hypothetical protein